MHQDHSSSIFHGATIPMLAAGLALFSFAPAARAEAFQDNAPAPRGEVAKGSATTSVKKVGQLIVGAAGLADALLKRAKSSSSEE